MYFISLDVTDNGVKVIGLHKIQRLFCSAVQLTDYILPELKCLPKDNFFLIHKLENIVLESGECILS